jgi:hypothetical protein
LFINNTTCVFDINPCRGVLDRVLLVIYMYRHVFGCPCRQGLPAIPSWCVNQSLYIGCLIKELGVDKSLGNPTYTPTTLTKEESWTIIRLFYVLLEFQPKMKNWIYHHSPGFLNYTSVLTDSVILPGPPNAPRNLFPIYEIIFKLYITGLQSYCDTSYSSTQKVVCIRCGFWNFLL